MGLERVLKDMITLEGPLSVERWFGLCLGHPELGYYQACEPFGPQGDFVTAPEISQVFGELIGIWCILVYELMGAPARFSLVELGPGRGTLMADIRRALAVSPATAQAAQLHLVETSARLQVEQRDRLGEDVLWHHSLASVPAGPAIFIANEFFDALPVQQFQHLQGGWHERLVGLDNTGELAFGLAQEATRMAEPFPQARAGDIAEIAPARAAVGLELGRRMAQAPGAALIIDYGYDTSAPGDTLQALSGHSPVAVLEMPGLVDLTAHVDFFALGTALAAGGARVEPLLVQRQFLAAMGLAERYEILERNATMQQKPVLERARDRLTNSKTGMGELFKVMAACSPHLPHPWPFGAPCSP